MKVAALQLSLPCDAPDANEAAIERAMRAAAEDGAQVIVLPELASTGYALASPEEAAARAEAVGGPRTSRWISFAERHRVHVCGGFAERDGDRIFNAALLTGPDGPVGRYRKLHLWDTERRLFDPGDLGLNTFEIADGVTVGMMICYDAWHPEVSRILKLKGADLILNPTCWPLGSAPPEGPSSAVEVHSALGTLNSAFFASANHAGEDRGIVYQGRSCITGPGGLIAYDDSMDRQTAVTADLAIESARDHRWSELTDPFQDRRTDVFDRLLGATPGQHPDSLLGLSG